MSSKYPKLRQHPKANEVIMQLVDAMVDHGNFEVRPEFFADPGAYFGKSSTIPAPSIDMREQAYFQGRNAALTGQVELGHNPYPADSEEAVQWAVGFSEVANFPDGGY
jgi:hypothetical protein